MFTCTDMAVNAEATLTGACIVIHVLFVHTISTYMHFVHVYRQHRCIHVCVCPDAYLLSRRQVEFDHQLPEQRGFCGSTHAHFDVVLGICLWQFRVYVCMLCTYDVDVCMYVYAHFDVLFWCRAWYLPVTISLLCTYVTYICRYMYVLAHFDVMFSICRRPKP